MELDHEKDGRWVADVAELPGAMAYGNSREEALAAARALALRVLAERLERGEAPAELFDGERLVLRLEPAEGTEQVLSVETQAELWRAWVERGPQGPIEDEPEPDFPTGPRPPTTRLFVSTDDKLGDESELRRSLESPW